VGTFRRAVYEALREVEPGETVTYAELAGRIGRPGAHRSVGTALSRNPAPVFVPCHRVVRSDGGLGGFTAEGGLALKREMLTLEGAIEPE
jgi:methylated-DNA-[protein]-cysteine S-methyltransferase